MPDLKDEVQISNKLLASLSKSQITAGSWRTVGSDVMLLLIIPHPVQKKHTEAAHC
jgi:hypothetical protein